MFAVDALNNLARLFPPTRLESLASRFEVQDLLNENSSKDHTASDLRKAAKIMQSYHTPCTSKSKSKAKSRSRRR